MKSLCDKLHILFNRMKKYNGSLIKNIPFERGIYIFLDRNEKYKGLDRIVRVGTHVPTSTEETLLKNRLRSHYKGNRKSSIFRKNIGRGIIIRDNYGDEMLKFWNSKKSDNFKLLPNYSVLDQNKKKIESEISKYLDGLYFVVFPIENSKDRVLFESAIIASLCKDSIFKNSISKKWLGNYVPNGVRTKIAENTLWCSDGANAAELSKEQYDRLEKICKEYFAC